MELKLRPNCPAAGRPFLEISRLRGPGVPEEARGDEIFEPVYRAGGGGTGLGLFISRELCEVQSVLHASISNPRDGGGSVFPNHFLGSSQRWEDQ